MLRAGGGRAEWPLTLRLSSHGQTPAGPVCLNTTQITAPVYSQAREVGGDGQLGRTVTLCLFSPLQSSPVRPNNSISIRNFPRLLKVAAQPSSV